MAKRNILCSSDEIKAIADAIRECTGDSKLYTISELSERIRDITLELVDIYNDGETPDYVIDECNRVKEQLNSIQGSDRHFTFAAITDIHHNSSYANGVKHAFQALKYFSSNTILDAIAVLGDYTDGDAMKNLESSGGARDDFKLLNRYLSALRDIPNLRQQGNHDFYKDDPSLVYSLIQAHSDNVVWGDEFGGYYYRDFENSKLRVINLNVNEINEVTSSNTSNGLIAISDKQYKWFIDSLDLSNKTDADMWQILLLSHQPLDWNPQDFTSANGWYYRIPQIIKGYVDGLDSSAFDKSNYTFTPKFDFSKGNNKAKIIGNIHGHTHNFNVSGMYLNLDSQHLGTTGIYRIATPNVSSDRQNYYNLSKNGAYYDRVTYEKTKDTKNDTSFVIYDINLDKKTIQSFHYGAGPEEIREIDYSTSNIVNYHSVYTDNLENASIFIEQATQGSSAVFSNVTDNKIQAGYQARITLIPEAGKLSNVIIKMGDKESTDSAVSDYFTITDNSDGTKTILISKVYGFIELYSIESEESEDVVNIIDSVGYIENTRLSGSSGNTTTSGASGYVTTNYIYTGDFVYGDTLYTTGVDFNSEVNGNCVLCAYDESGTKLALNYIKEGVYVNGFSCTFTNENNPGNLTLKFTGSSVPYQIRFAGKGSGADLVVTKNAMLI